MTYLKKNINLTLLVLIGLLIILLVTVALFFNIGLKERTNDYETTSNNLTLCQDALHNYQNRFSDAQKQINSTAQDIRRYDQLYEEKVSELKKVNEDLDASNKKNKALELIKASLETEKASLETEKDSLNNQVSILNDKIDALNKKVSYWKSCYNDCEGGDCTC